MKFSGSREAKKIRAGSRHAGESRKLSNERREILLIEVERQNNYDCPNDDFTEKPNPLVSSDSFEHPVIIFRECMSFVEHSFKFRIHVEYILAPHTGMWCPSQESNLNQLVRSEPFYPLN